MNEDLNSLKCRCVNGNPDRWHVYRFPEKKLVWNLRTGSTFENTGYDNYVVRCPVCKWSHFLGNYISDEKQAQIYNDLQRFIELMKKAQESERAK